ncbi:MAG: hypothetical protein WB919_21805 [Candidatus Sulfotelmatobacter sp.]
MSFKAQLYPLSSTEVSPGVAVRSSWGGSPANPQDVKFLRFGLVYGSDTSNKSAVSPSQRKFGVGLALAFGVSAGFWTGVALMVARIWR